MMLFTSIVIGSVIYSLAAVVALHCLNTGYDAISQPLSYHAVGAYGWLMASALGAFAVSALTLAFNLERGAARVSRAGIAFLFGAGACLVIASIFPTDVTANNLPITVAGAIHVAASYLASPCLVAAALLLSRRFDDARRRDAARFALALASWASLVVLVIVNHLDLHVGGIGQRVFLALIALWLLLTAFRVPQST